jgi:hypothetical protein
MSVNMDGTAQTLARISKTVQIWFWPTLPNPYRVQTRLPRPGQPYRLHSAHDTLSEAVMEAVKLEKAQQGHNV